MTTHSQFPEPRRAARPDGRRAPARLKAAQAALLTPQAESLLRDVSDMFCEPTRAQIARALGPGPLAVSEIATVIGRSKWSTSRHLRVLRERNLVAAERRGRSVLYSLSEAAIPALDSLAVISAAAA